MEAGIGGPISTEQYEFGPYHALFDLNFDFALWMFGADINFIPPACRK